MKFKQFLPAIQLQEYIKQYWLLEADDDLHYHEDIFFPLGAVEIIFHFGFPLLRFGNAGWSQEKQAFVEGQQSGIMRVKQKGAIKTVGITFYPWATISFFKTGPHIFTNANFRSDEINPTLNDLYEQLAVAKMPDDIPGICNQYFLKHLPDYHHHNRPYLEIISAFKKQNENFTVSDLKSNWTYSGRLFEIKFKELTGTSAGEFIKKKRMSYALNKMVKGRLKSLTDVSYDAGYFDQSHFIRDFKVYFGITPKRFDSDYPLLQHFV